MWIALILRLAVPLRLIARKLILPWLLPVLHWALLRVRCPEILRTGSVTMQWILKLSRAGT